jgi:hypothetical protein
MADDVRKAEPCDAPPQRGRIRRERIAKVEP